MTAMLKGFGRGPLQARGPRRGAGVRKPRKEETAGRKGRCLVGRGATYGDFGVADGALVGLRGPVARIVVGGSEDDGVFRGRGCERRVWARRLEEERRPCEDIAFLLQRAVGGGETALRGGKRGDDHEVSILIGVGDGERAGRTPSKVSTMIIRPPQHGQRRTGEAVSAALSGSARERSGAASNWRALDVAGSNDAGEQAVMA